MTISSKAQPIIEAAPYTALTTITSGVQPWTTPPAYKGIFEQAENFKRHQDA